MASAAGAIAIIGEIAQLEPIAFALVAKLIHGLQGKTDAEVLAGDASDLAAIITLAHQEASGNIVGGISGALPPK